MPKVGDEIRTNSMTWVRFNTAVESGRIKVKMPSEEFSNEVKVYASKLGDSYLLSETDMQLLAIALELKSGGYTPEILTDDYSIQNVATKMEITFNALVTFGIRRLLEWIRYCPACHREYPVNSVVNVCQVCGTELKRKPKRNLKAEPKKGSRAK